jgi:hypothetical protein
MTLMATLIVPFLRDGATSPGRHLSFYTAIRLPLPVIGGLP